MWQEVRPSLLFFTKEGEKSVSERFCIKAQTRKRSNDAACAEIEVAKYFHCHHCDERVAIVLCLARQGKLKSKTVYKKPSPCGHKRQCKEIAALTRGRNLLIEHGCISKAESRIPLRKVG